MWAKIITIKKNKDLNYFSLCALNLFNTGFHNLSWITEISELFDDILIYWDAPVLATTELATRVAFEKHTPGQFITMSVKLKNKKQNKTIEALVCYIFQAF